MSDFQFPAQSRQHMLTKLHDYCSKELDIELGQFDGEFLLDFFSQEFAGYFYNQGLYDAQAVLHSKMELVADAIYELEKPQD